jgi:hypothetical protein
MKRIAVVVSGWHYPLGFYEMVSKQKLPKGWEADLFVISHRDPKDAAKEKKGRKFTGDRAYLDERLYKGIAGVEEIESLGFTYIEKPNTIGDWGNSNQWLADHDYREYDLLLFTHDDNLILQETWFYDIIRDRSFKDWEILANTVGMPAGMIRGSCEFFKPSLIEKLGGQFDLSETTLTREGETTTSEDRAELYDWNSTVYPLMRFIEENKIAVGHLAPGYRFSCYVLEGERGYISNTHGANTEVEDKNLDILKQYGFL